MKKYLRQNKAITLIALVISIIVLLILAGVTIASLTGDNGLLSRTTEARARTIHANVFEQMQLEASAYTVDRTAGVYSNSLIDYLKSKSIISDIPGEDEKWLINVTTLLKSNQSMGNGTYPNDVYVLEKQHTSTGSIVNTKVATTTPIKIAETPATQITYKVLYYENNTSENLSLGNLTDSNASSTPVAKTDESTKLTEYFSKGPDVIWNSENASFQNVAPVTDATDKLKYMTGGQGCDIVQYRDSLYIITYVDEPWSATATMINIDLTKFGEQTIEGKKVLVTPSTPDVLIHLDYTYYDEVGVLSETPHVYNAAAVYRTPNRLL